MRTSQHVRPKWLVITATSIVIILNVTFTIFDLLDGEALG